MRNLLYRAFDKTYIILAPAVLLTYFVPIRMRVGPIMIVPFVVLWLMMMILKDARCELAYTRRFLAFFVPLALFFLLRSFLFGYQDYDQVPFLRHLQYSGLVCVYLYILHYSLSRGRFKELRLLNGIVLFSLAYGCFASADMEIGGYRNMGVLVGTSRETYEDTLQRLTYASSGISNYGDVYAMAFINVGMMAVVRYCKLKWKFFYVAFSLLFFYGIYKAAYSTGLFVASVTVAIVWFMRICKFSERSFRIGICLYSLAFVVAVAFPDLLSPFSGILKQLAIVFEPISSDYSLRLQSIAEAMSGYKDTYSVERARLYWNSLDIFIRRPLYGYRLNQILFDIDKNMRMLGHSYLFDSFAAGGVVLGGLLMVGLYKFTQYLKYAYKNAGVSGNFMDSWYAATAAIFIVTSINQANSFNLLIGYLFVVPSIPFFGYRGPMTRSVFIPYPAGEMHG